MGRTCDVFRAVGTRHGHRGRQDSSNAVVPGVAVTVLNVETNAATNVITSDSGTYSAVNLPPGTYRVQAVLEGFQTSIAEGVIVTPGGSSRIDLTLSAGGVTSEIKVTADATQLHTEDARSVTAVSNKLIDELPLVVGGAMRSPFDLISTVPEARGSGGTVSLGGGQGGAFGATLDGVSVNTNRNADTAETAFLTPSLEAITEFSVETNGFKPEFGQAGGGVITFASKSGTNTLRGSVYEFHRNDALDARGFFERTKGIYKQNDYGVSLGGPVRIPRLYDGTNKTFFFAAYEGLPQPSGQQRRVPQRPDSRNVGRRLLQLGRFPGRRLVIYDPATTRPNPNGTGFIRDPFPNNKIPQERFSTVAKQYIALARSVLVPNRPGLTPGTFGYVNNNYASEDRSTIETTHKFSLKIDHTLSSRHRLAYVFNRTGNELVAGENGATGLPAPFSGFQQSTFDGDLHRASWDAVGSRIVNHLSIGANTFNKNAFSPNVDQNWAPRVCIPNAVDCDQNMGVIEFSEFSTWGASSCNGTEQPRLTIKNDTTFLAGNHTLKGGFLFDRQQANGFGQQDYGGRAGFDFEQTGLPGVTSFTSGSLVRLLPPRLREYRPHRDHPLSPADLSVLRLLRPGRLARERQAGGQLRRALRIHASAGAGGDQYSDFSADRAEPGGERLSRRADLRR